MADRNLELGVIGNCAIAALVDPLGTIVWSCFPRLDGDPVFCALLHQNGHDGAFTVEMKDIASSTQRYLDNSAILETLVTDSGGNTIEITDYCPRFLRFGRMFRPPVIMRRIRPVSGRPIVTVRIKPRMANGAVKPEITRGSNHMRFVGPRNVIRVTTNAPISYLLEERSFRLGDDLWFVLGPDEAVPEDVRDVGRNQLEATLDWWQTWVRGLSIPFEWQEAVIRSAITLKLCNYEETGAIVAALTTSIPEAPNTQRNWDYRYCWIRDSFFVIRVLNALGVTRTMEDYIRFITDIVDDARDGGIQPVYSISRESNLEEVISADLTGYRGMGPVRIGNQAYVQKQNDVYGSLVLACTHVFFDQRLIRQGANRGLVRAARGHRPARRAGVRPARCRAVGTAHQRLDPHLLRHHELGGVRPAGQDRAGGGPRRPRRTLALRRRPAARDHPEARLEREAQGARLHLRRARSRRQHAAGGAARLPEGGRSALSHDGGGDRRRPEARRLPVPLRRRRRFRPARRPPSPSAPSGTSTPWWRWAGARKRAPCSRPCWRGATSTACCRKTSRWRPANCGATIRRPIRWSASSTPRSSSA